MNRSDDALHPLEALSDYLDGELSPARRSAVDAHLRACPECGAVLDELRAVTVRARQLPDPPLERDLWPAIEQRLGDPRRERAKEAARPRAAWLWVRQFSFSVPQLAGAALALVLASSGVVWWALRATAPRANEESAAIVSSVPIAQSAGSAAAETGPAADAGGESLATFDPAHYDAAIADLQSTLQQNRDRLDPATVKTVEGDLAVIDKAIDQARRALAADPSSPYLNGHLAEQLRSKLRVLRRMTDAVTADYTGSNS